MLRLAILIIPVAVTVYAFIDVLTARAHATRRGPKWLWAIAVLVLPLVGAVLWFVFGRPQQSRPHDIAPDDDPDFLRRLRLDFPQHGDDDASGR